MKPFVAIAVLVAASLTAASGAPAQQQQVLTGSQAAGGLRQSPSSSSFLQSPSGFGFPGLSGVWSVGPSLNNPAFGPSAFWFGSAPGVGGGRGSGFGASSSSSPSSSAAGGAGSRLGSWSGQVSLGGNYARGPYQGVWGSGYYPSVGLGQSFYGPSYGGASWGYAPAYGSQWGLSGNGYSGGYGGGYGGVYPAGFGYGGLSFGSVQGPAGVGQVPAAVPGGRHAGSSRSSSSSQRPAARSE